jgi:hypothetical protein
MQVHLFQYISQCVSKQTAKENPRFCVHNIIYLGQNTHCYKLRTTTSAKRNGYKMTVYGQLSLFMCICRKNEDRLQYFLLIYNYGH